MKKFILTLTAVLVTVAASAQTSFTSTKLAIAADDGGLEIDFDSIKSAIGYGSGFEFEIKEDQGPSIDIGSIIKYTSGTYTIPGSVTTSYITINIPSYTLTVGKSYQLRCNLPSDFWFKLMCHNPYDNFRVRIFGADSNGDICFKQTIGTMWYNSSLVVGSHWLCYGGYTSLRDLNYYLFTLNDAVNEWTGSAADVVECFLCLSFGYY